MRRGDYGYDAPYALTAFSGLALMALAVAGVMWIQDAVRNAAIFTGYAAFFGANALSFLYTTRRGKFIEWERILDDLRLRGDERVLDMG
jgi:arsenite methyltransferase